MNNYNLRQLRKNADISLQDMAYLVDMDVSNLSKNERGMKPSNLNLCQSYALVTGSRIEQLLQTSSKAHIERLSERITSLIIRLEHQKQSNKVKHRIAKLHSVLDTLSCLHEQNEHKEL